MKILNVFYYKDEDIGKQVQSAIASIKNALEETDLNVQDILFAAFDISRLKCVQQTGHFTDSDKPYDWYGIPWKNYIKAYGIEPVELGYREDRKERSLINIVEDGINVHAQKGLRSWFLRTRGSFGIAMYHAQDLKKYEGLQDDDLTPEFSIRPDGVYPLAVIVLKMQKSPHEN